MVQKLDHGLLDELKREIHEIKRQSALVRAHVAMVAPGDDRGDEAHHKPRSPSSCSSWREDSIKSCISLLAEKEPKTLRRPFVVAKPEGSNQLGLAWFF